MAGYTLEKSLSGAAVPLTARRPVVIEALEGRRLLSATPGAATVTVAAPATATVMPSNGAYGTRIALRAGQSFDGYLGVVTGAPVNSATTKISASINWGDKSVSTQGVVTIGASGHIDVGGAHTYSAAGDYSIVITVWAAPIPVPGLATPDYVRLLGTINSKAVVIKSSPSLDGTIKGTLLPLPTPSEDLAIMGSGNAGAMGAVSASGAFGLSEFTTSRPAPAARTGTAR